MANIFELFKQIEGNKTQNEIKNISYIVAGLGNPGEKYANTRHNMGFMCLDYIAGKYGFKIDRVKFQALCGDYTINDKRILFIKPQTMMNLSGDAVREAADFYKISPENIIIIYDDISIPAGQMRVKRKGSDGGHNGIKSIISQLETQSFPRIKIGVDSPASADEMIGWVLGVPFGDDKEKIKKCIENSLPCLELIIQGKIDEAMNKYN